MTVDRRSMLTGAALSAFAFTAHACQLPSVEHWKKTKDQ